MKNGSGKTNAVTTKIDAELLQKLTTARTRAGMSESGFMRLALDSYLSNLELRTIGADIGNAAALVAAAAESVSQPAVIARMDAFELRVQEQLNGFIETMKGLLGEPTELGELLENTMPGDQS
jgi:hypothetical protein